MRGRAWLAAAAVLVLVGGCGGGGAVADAGPDPAATPERARPSALVGQWTLTGPDVEEGAVLNLGAGGITLFGECGVLGGSWSGRIGGSFLGRLDGGDPRCFRGGGEITPSWLSDARGFSVSGADRALVSATGDVLATLQPGAERPEVGPNNSADTADVPTVTADERAQLDREPPAFPAGIRVASTEDLIGLWVLPGREDDGTDGPHARFRPDGTWQGSDGCNGLGGPWSLRDGVLLLVGGPQTLIGCENIDPLADAVLAGFDGDALVLLGEDGRETQRLVGVR